MKKFILKNAMAVAAMAIAAGSYGLMSFGTTQDELWFEVDASGNITSTVSPPTGTCVENVPTNICAVLLPEGHGYTNISQVPAAPKAGRTSP